MTEIRITLIKIQFVSGCYTFQTLTIVLSPALRRLVRGFKTLAENVFKRSADIETVKSQFFEQFIDGIKFHSFRNRA